MNPNGVICIVLDSNLEVNEFELQSHYYVHFQTNTFAKGINPLYPLCCWLISSTTFFSTRVALALDIRRKSK